MLSGQFRLGKWGIFVVSVLCFDERQSFEEAFE